MNKKIKNFLIFGVVLFVAIIGILIGTGSMSTIGEFNKEQCLINSTTSSCEIKMTLPENRELDSYSLDLTFHKTEGVYGTPIQLTPFTQGVYYSYHDTDLTSSLEGEEILYLYLYKLPSDWKIEDIYSIKYSMTTNGWVTQTLSNADIDIDPEFGVINFPYTSSSINVCTTSTPPCIIKTRTYSDGDSYQYLYNEDDFESNIEYEDLSADTYDGVQTSGVIEFTGTDTLSRYMDTYNLTKDGFVMYSTLNVDEYKKGYTNWGLTLPPKVMMSYAGSLRPTDVQIFIGETYVETIDGQIDGVSLVSLKDHINNYCERTTSTERCEVPIIFKSAENGGLIIIEDEKSVLKAQEVEGSSSSNGLTGAVTFVGNSFDYSGHPTQSYATAGILLVLIVGGVMLIGGKKK